MKLAGVWSESAPGFFVLRRRCCSSGSGIGAWVLRPSPSVLLVWVWNRRLVIVGARRCSSAAGFIGARQRLGSSARRCSSACSGARQRLVLL
nr:hypothetical protein CFP56_78012 [Quercus suber]